jgi:hypothetical protein
MESIANPHLNKDSGVIIAFPGETFGLTQRLNMAYYGARLN